jgi:hypothetical protein
VASDITAMYHQASANVAVVWRDKLADVPDDGGLAGLPRPYLRHTVRDTLPLQTSADCGGSLGGIPRYGQTRAYPQQSLVPLLYPDMDLVTNLEGQTETGFGISQQDLFEGRFNDSVEGMWATHFPNQDRNTRLPGDTLFLGWGQPVANPRPVDVLRYRWANVIAHETAHGFGVVDLTPFPIRSWDPSIPAPLTQLNAVKVDWSGCSNGNSYSESDATVPVESHEPTLGAWAQESVAWVMTAYINRWLGLPPDNNDPFPLRTYDQPPTEPPPGWQPTRWLTFDHPLRFSLTLDYCPEGTCPDRRTDASLQHFFSERVPFCSAENKLCR